MEKDFHIDDFERLLKEKADEFRMYPSKRIWHSIYNNIHPGRKWPSVIVSIMLVSSLLLIGYLNTGYKGLYDASENKVIQPETIDQFKSPLVLSLPLPLNDPGNSDFTAIIPGFDKNGFVSKHNPINTNPQTKAADKSADWATITKINKQIISENLQDLVVTGKRGMEYKNSRANKESSVDFTNGIASNPFLSFGQVEIADNATDLSAKDANNVPGEIQSDDLSQSQKIAHGIILDNLTTNEFSNTDLKKENNGIVLAGISTVEKNNAEIKKKTTISTEDKDWIENYALYNRPVTRKWANRLYRQTYFTPSVVYRTLNNNTDVSNTIIVSPFASSTTGQNVNYTVNQKPSFGFELGTGIQYSITKGLQLKTGLQVNFTQYNSEAFQNSHPVATMLTMHDINSNSYYQVYRSTPYSIKSGLESINLHNQTFQISIPIGADLTLLGNEDLKWKIGATIQPTYVIGGKSYLISSDRNNYVRETALLNNWNLNAGFETFITLKSKKGLTWQLGPQFRTQLFSTNSKTFAVEERLVNYGLKFGVSKTIR